MGKMFPNIHEKNLTVEEKIAVYQVQLMRCPNLFFRHTDFWLTCEIDAINKEIANRPILSKKTEQSVYRKIYTRNASASEIEYFIEFRREHLKPHDDLIDFEKLRQTWQSPGKLVVIRSMEIQIAEYEWAQSYLRRMVYYSMAERYQDNAMEAIRVHTYKQDVTNSVRAFG